ncbi:MAG: DUF1295 domain-containing protein [Microscillaceae bacterium]|nr:DUF1295 domain-containing protein [Microscillaceae bacterium]
MTVSFFYNYIVFPWIGLAVITFVSLFFVSAPYGRHTRAGWGILINNRLSWIVMEIISPLTLSYYFLTGTTEKTAVMWIFVALWWIHYFNRSLIFPFRIRSQNKHVPVLITLLAMFFNSVNGFINGYYLGTLSPAYGLEWLYDPRFILGLLLFLLGFAINLQSDEILMNLRKPGETAYKIPQGGFYRYVSSPNYMGECIEWIGFAVLTWSLPGAAFALWTIANLAPRAVFNHRWYLEMFEDYPKNRKALIPFIV